MSYSLRKVFHTFKVGFSGVEIQAPMVSCGVFLLFLASLVSFPHSPLAMTSRNLCCYLYPCSLCCLFSGSSGLFPAFSASLFCFFFPTALCDFFVTFVAKLNSCSLWCLFLGSSSLFLFSFSLHLSLLFLRVLGL